MSTRLSAIPHPSLAAIGRLGTRCGRCGCRTKNVGCACSCHALWCDCHGERLALCTQLAPLEPATSVDYGVIAGPARPEPR